MQNKVYPFGEFIQTYTGKKFYPFSPRVEDINIEDIAHALSMNCRFNGHVNSFYSVAQHSVLVSKTCEEQFAFTGLMHDSAEAYISDIARPLKRMESFTFYKELEDNILKVIFKKYNVEVVNDHIKYVDSRMTLTEGRDLMPDISYWPMSKKYGTYDFEVVPVGWKLAKTMFLKRFKELCI